MLLIHLLFFFFFFNDTATTEIYTLSLHDALPISGVPHRRHAAAGHRDPHPQADPGLRCPAAARSEEHTSELQSPCNLVCRLLLEKKKKKKKHTYDEDNQREHKFSINNVIEHQHAH